MILRHKLNLWQPQGVFVVVLQRLAPLNTHKHSLWVPQIPFMGATVPYIS